MKRCRFGLLLLAGLLALNLGLTRAGRHGPLEVAELVRQADQAEQRGDYPKAAALTESAGAAWEKAYSLQNLLHHREKLQRVTLLLHWMDRTRGDPGTFTLITEQLVLRLEALGGRERPRFPGSGR